MGDFSAILEIHFQGRFRRYGGLVLFVVQFQTKWQGILFGLRAAEDKAKETQKWVGMPNGPAARIDWIGWGNNQEFGKLHLHESEVHFFLQGMLNSTYGTFSRTFDRIDSEG